VVRVRPQHLGRSEGGRRGGAQVGRAAGGGPLERPHRPAPLGGGDAAVVGSDEGAQAVQGAPPAVLDRGPVLPAQVLAPPVVHPAVGGDGRHDEGQVLGAQPHHTGLGRGLSGRDQQAARDVVHAVGVLRAGCRAAGVLVQPAAVGEPVQVEEARRGDPACDHDAASSGLDTGRAARTERPIAA
jgi:hypothetical protein